MKEKVDSIINAIDNLILGVLRNRNTNSIENYKNEFINLIKETFELVEDKLKENKEDEKPSKKKTK